MPRRWTAARAHLETGVPTMLVKEKTMKQKIPLSHLTFLGICIALSLVSKRIVSPVTNILTDLIRIPGGGAAAAFSIMFLAVGTSGLQWRWATTAAAFVQSMIALSLGMSSYQGLFAVMTYTLPGFVIDLLRILWPNRDKEFFAISCGTANAAGALLTNFLVFRLKGIPFLLWMLVALTVGMFGGCLGELLFQRVLRIPECRRVLCQKS